MSTMPPVVETLSPFASWKFEHAAVRVPDFDAAVEWYVETLDFRLVKSALLREKMYGFMTAPGAESGFMVELIAGPGAEHRPAYEDIGSSLRLLGLHHVAFRVGSVDDAIRQLKSRKVAIISEPHNVPELGLRLGFFADPWGNLFELIQAITP
jgi:catechol 2,3-dioxygenase-like lactoylglutathione lyase family enzyme